MGAAPHLLSIAGAAPQAQSEGPPVILVAMTSPFDLLRSPDSHRLVCNFPMFGFLGGIHTYFNDTGHIKHNHLKTIVFLQLIHFKMSEFTSGSTYEKKQGFVVGYFQLHNDR